MAKVMVEDQSRVQPSGEDKRTADALADIKDAFPKRFAMEWKCYQSRKEVPSTAIAEWKRSGKRSHDLLGNNFDVTNPCPAPVKIDPNKGWVPSNVRDCGYVVHGCTGRTAFARACVHAEEHYDWWLEVMEQEYRDSHDGKDGPPMTTKITLPIWHEEGIELEAGASEMDQKIAYERKHMEKDYVKDEEKDAVGSASKLK